MKKGRALAEPPQIKRPVSLQSFQVMGSGFNLFSSLILLLSSFRASCSGVLPYGFGWTISSQILRIDCRAGSRSSASQTACCSAALFLCSRTSIASNQRPASASSFLSSLAALRLSISSRAACTRGVSFFRASASTCLCLLLRGEEPLASSSRVVH